MDTKHVSHLPCDSCGSSDALCDYGDHTFCFSCSTHKWTKVLSKEYIFNRKFHAMPEKPFVPLVGEVRALKYRGLTFETCQKWGYQVGKLNGQLVHIANYYRNGTIIGQKIRTKDKNFKWFGSTTPGLYGMHLWKPGKNLIITEGEIDALSVSQINNNLWPVISIPHGAQSAFKSIKDNLEYVEAFDRVVFMFDQDEPGIKAAEECAKLLSPGKGHIAQLPLKDANEMLMVGRNDDLTKCMWNAKPWTPSGIVNGIDLWENIKEKISFGLSYPWKTLTSLMFGMRESEIYVLGAGTGLGKTTVCKEIAYHLAITHNQKVGLLFLEEQNKMTVLSMMSLYQNRMLHIPGVEIEEDVLKDTFNTVFSGGNFFLFDHFGSTSFTEIISRIRYLVVSCGVKFVFLDHLAALTTGNVSNDERREIDFIMTKLSSIVRELKFTLVLVSHLNTPLGTISHEEGGRVKLSHFRGSRAIGQWADAVWGLERNQQPDDPSQQNVLTFRILKDRYTGQAAGKTFNLKFNVISGRLKEYNDNDDEMFFPVENKICNFSNY